MKVRSRVSGRAPDKAAIAGRLRSIREEVFGDDGPGEVARLLGLPERTWLNYERGVTIPGDVLLRDLIVTGIEPIWLLDGDGTKYRAMEPDPPVEV